MIVEICQKALKQRVEVGRRGREGLQFVKIFFDLDKWTIFIVYFLFQRDGDIYL